MAMDNDQESISPNICRDHVVFAKLGYINLLLMLLCFCAAGSLEKHILSTIVVFKCQFHLFSLVVEKTMFETNKSIIMLLHDTAMPNCVGMVQLLSSPR